MTDLFGAYQLRARVQPLLLVAFPGAVVAYAFGAGDDFIGRIGGALATFGVVTLLAAVARDRGRELEADLWRDWGGPPTTTMMLSTSASASPALRANREHARRLLPDLGALSDERDAADPEGTRRDIERFVTHLRERTRDRQRFPIVFDANVGYGFRRNILGLRLIGAAVSATAAAAGIIGLVLVALGNLDRPIPGLLVAVLVAASATVLWLRADEEWVRVQAVRYAEALLAAGEAIDARRSVADD